MKISELRPCIACHGQLVGKGKGPHFYVLRMSLALLNQRNVSSVLGTMAIVGGGQESAGALQVAEAMAAGAEDAVTIGMDYDKNLQTEVHICADCYMKSPLPEWGEALTDRRRKGEEVSDDGE